MHPGVVPVIADPGVDPPASWVEALDAVARDLPWLQYGSVFRVDRLVWELLVDDRYEVSIRWTRPGSDRFWSRFTGLSMDASFAEAAVWVAEAAQEELVQGTAVVQWPSMGWQLLTARVVDGAPSWVDPHGDVVVSPIGALRENAHRWR